MNRTERRIAVAKLVLAGQTYRQIAAALHVSHLTIGNDVRWTLDQWKAEAVKTTGEWVTIELNRIDSMMSAIWLNCTLGSLPHQQQALRLMERRAKLLGLDAETKVSVSGPDGGPIQHSVRIRPVSQLDMLTDEDLDDLERILVALPANVGGGEAGEVQTVVPLLPQVVEVQEP